MPKPTPLTLALATFCLLGAADAAAQGSEPRAGVEIHGQVMDAATGTPMVGATVVLEPEMAGVFPGAAAGSSFAAAARTTTTDARGRYRFPGLSPGPYRLHAARYGYRPYSLSLEVRGKGAAVSVGLEADPIALEPIRSRGQARGPYVAADPFGPDADLARLLVSDMRRRLYLSTDVRELTHADVLEGVSLGDPDIFRALQRLPGVTTRSDYTAALWTRGAPWSQTRVYYDGIPLFNPLHALGMISGISSSAVGTVWFHPGVRSAAIGEGAAGVIDLRSRPAYGDGELNLQADASLATAGITLDQRVLEGRGGWMLSGRRSYLDWLSDLARRAAGQEDARFPYHFTETSGRVDGRISEAHAVEATWLWEGDELTSASSDGDPIRADWGNALARVSWSADLGSYNLQHTVGGSSHRGLVRLDPALSDLASAEALRRSETTMEYATLRGTLWPDAAPMAGPPWTIGYDVVGQRVRYHGPIPLSVPAAETAVRPEVAESVWPDSMPVSWESELPLVALWGERLWSPTDRLAIRGGLRAEVGGEIRDALPVRLAPRVTVRFTPVPELALSAGLARVLQYSQAVAPGGVQLASLVSTDAWLLAGPSVPAIRSHLATAGLEVWLAPDRIVTVNGFGRFADGIVIPNPQPGPVLRRSPSLVIGHNAATGLEVSVRQLAGPLTGSAAYSLTRSRISASGMEFPSAADRTQVLNATGMVHPLRGLRMGAAFTAATGVPFTTAVSDPASCAAEPGCDPAGPLPWAGEPNATRGPAYVSLDLLMDWSMKLGDYEVAVYGQLRNILGRENATVYVGDGSGCLVVGCSTDDLRNAYERGVPRLPVIGIRVRR